MKLKCVGGPADGRIVELEAGLSVSIPQMRGAVKFYEANSNILEPEDDYMRVNVYERRGDSLVFTGYWSHTHYPLEDFFPPPERKAPVWVPANKWVAETSV